MNLTFHFNTDYTSSGLKSYTKVSAVLPDGGLICVIINNLNDDLQRQKYLPNEWNVRNTKGVRDSQYCKGFKSFVTSKWSGLSESLKRNVAICVKALPSAYYMYLRASKTSSMQTTIDELNTARQWIDQLLAGQVPNFEDEGVVTTTTTTTEATTSATGEWGTLNMANLAGEDINKIVAKIVSEGNPTEGVSYNGNKYRIIATYKGNMLHQWHDTTPLQSTTEDATTTTEDTQSNAGLPKRHTCKMAQIIDDSNLVEFVKGCYYRIVAQSGNYYNILNDDGKERLLNSKRIKVCEVYCEPPVK